MKGFNFHALLDYNSNGQFLNRLADDKTQNLCPRNRATFKTLPLKTMINMLTFDPLKWVVYDLLLTVDGQINICDVIIHLFS